MRLRDNPSIGPRGYSVHVETILAAMAFGLAALTGSPALAIESLAVKVLGFSPDGRYFAFVQYGGHGDHSSYIAETFVIDASRDRFVEGVRLRLIVDMRENNPDEDEELKEILAAAATRAAPLMSRYGITKPSALLVRVEEAKPREVSPARTVPSPGRTR